MVSIDTMGLVKFAHETDAGDEAARCHRNEWFYRAAIASRLSTLVSRSLATATAG